MIDILITAYTPTSGYKTFPPYINVRRTGDYDADILLTIRGNEKSDGTAGNTVAATFTKEQFALFLLQALRAL